MTDLCVFFSVLPEEDPIISGQDEVYIPGSDIILNCTSERSKPAAQLMWYINEQRVSATKNAPSKRLLKLWMCNCKNETYAMWCNIIKYDITK